MDAETLYHLLNDRCYPLRPAFEEEDEARYLPLDDTDAKFKHFCTVHSDAARFAARGHLIYVTGGGGSGKTSLLHRCAHHLKQLLSTPSPIIVDLTVKRWAERESVPRLKRTFHEMLDELAKVAESDAISGLRAAIEVDPIHAFSELSEVLSNLNPPSVMVVLLSPKPTADELLQVAAAAEPRLVFFAELADPEQIVRCEAELPQYMSAKRSITELKIGPLKSGDGRLLVDGIAKDEQSLPAIPNEVVDRWIDRKNRSITFLKRLTLGVRLLAQERQATVVEVEDVTEYLTLMMPAQDGR